MKITSYLQKYPIYFHVNTVSDKMLKIDLTTKLDHN